MHCVRLMIRRWAAAAAGLALWAALVAPAGATGSALSLEEAVELGKEHAVRLRLAEAELAAARLGLEQARAASLMQPDPVLLLQAETGAALAEQALAAAAHEVEAQIARDYFNVLRLTDLVDVLEEALTLQERQTEITRRRRESGVATELDMMRAELELVRRRGELQSARERLELARHNLRLSLGRPEGAPLELAPAELEPEWVAISLDEAIAEAMANRLEPAQAALAVEAARKELELSMNDYTSGLRQQSLAVEAEKAELLQRQAADGIALQVHNALIEAQEAYRRIGEAEKAVEVAEETLRIVQATFDAQMATDLEVLQAAVNLTQARTAAVHAVFDYHIAVSDFYQALGWGIARREGGGRS